MRVVIDPDGRAIFEPDPRRALDLREQQIGLILEPANLKPAAGDRAVLYLAAIIIRHKLAAADLAKHLPLVGQVGRTLLKAADEQIRGSAIDRHVIDPGLGARSIEDGFVIAGDKAGILAEPRDLQRDEMVLEEGARLGGLGNLRSPRRAAGIAQRNPQALCGRRQCVFRGDRLAACAKCPVGREMIVIDPAGDIGPG